MFKCPTRYAKLAFDLDRQVTELEREKAALVSAYRGLRSEFDQLNDYSVHQNKILTKIQYKMSHKHGGVNLAHASAGRLVDAPIYGNAMLESANHMGQPVDDPTDEMPPTNPAVSTAGGSSELLGNWPVMVAENSTVAEGSLAQLRCWASVSTADVALLDKRTMETIVSWPFDAIISYGTERQVISLETTGPAGGFLFLVTNPTMTKDFFNVLDYAGELN